MAATRVFSLGSAIIASVLISLPSHPIVGVSALLLHLLLRCKAHPIGSPKRHANDATSFMAFFYPIAAWMNLSYEKRMSIYSGNWEDLTEYMFVLGTLAIGFSLIIYISVFTFSYLISKSKEIITSHGGKNNIHQGEILSKASNLDISESDVFLQAKNEIENDTKDEGIWAIAYSNTTNKKEAKKLYIKLRVDKIYEDSELSSLDSVKEKSLFGIWGGLLVLIILFIMAASFIGL